MPKRSRASKPAPPEKKEDYVRLTTVATELRVPLEALLEAREHSDFSVFGHSSKTVLSQGWIPLSKESHGYLLYRIEKLSSNSKFPVEVDLMLHENFRVADIHVLESTYQALKAANFLPEKKAEPKEGKNQGTHWEKKRIEVLSAALQIVNDSLSEGNSKIWAGSPEKKRINASKLAEEIHDNRHRWPTLKDELVGTSLRNITETLQKALKNTD